MATGRVPTTANSPLTTKGDLFGYSTAPARLAVGANGETLVADSSTSTGLRYQGSMAAGKNYVINGGMDIWQRGTSFTNPTAAGAFYTADRWGFNRFLDATGTTVSQSTDTQTGFQYSLKWQRTASNTSTNEMDGWYALESKDSYLYAGKTVTLSFYAKKGANYSGGSFTSSLNSGTGTDQRVYAFTGSANVATAANTLTTSWQRFSITGTVGTNVSQLGIQFVWNPTGTAGADDSVYLTGVQLEIGSVATTFTRTGGTIQGELAACQRYYYRQTSDATALYAHLGYARGDSATVAIGDVPLPVTMRVTPTAIDYSNISVTDGAAVYLATSAALTGNQNNAKFAAFQLGFASGVTQFRFYYIVTNNNSSSYLGFSAEL